MSRVERFLAKPVKVTLEGEEFDIKPLRMKEFGMVQKMSNGTEEEKEAATQNLINHYLKQMFPDASEEELSNISLTFLNVLMEAIMEVNNLTEKSEGIELVKKSMQNDS